MAIWCSHGGGAVQLTRGCCAVCAGEGGCCAVCVGEVAILRQDIIKYKTPTLPSTGGWLLLLVPLELCLCVGSQACTGENV